MERNAPALDISKPIDAIILAAFLFKLSHIYAPALQMRVEKARDEIRLGQREFMPWTQDHQNPKPKTSEDPEKPETTERPKKPRKRSQEKPGEYTTGKRSSSRGQGSRAVLWQCFHTYHNLFIS